MASPIDFIVDTDEFGQEVDQEDRIDPHSALRSWILEKVQDWEDYRRMNYDTKWDEYYRLWKGVYDPKDKSRNSERSRLIAPALQQAIEVACAEIEEALFGKGRWFDVSDDYIDEVNQEDKDIEPFRNILKEDMEKDKVPDSISETVLNAALYGTGIGKVVVDEKTEHFIDSEEIAPGVYRPIPRTKQTVRVYLEPIHPKNFAIDYSARTLEEALGCAHIYVSPKHKIIEAQRDGTYLPGEIGDFPDSHDIFESNSRGEVKTVNRSDSVKVIEYHGLVPEVLLNTFDPTNEESLDSIINGVSYQDIEESPLVEAIVVIINDVYVAKVTENRFLKKDRSIIAFPYDRVPNRFWGRGVAEKGYNPQKALDAELRARIDAMALSVHPMMGIDASRIPRGADFTIRPGNTLLTNGDPRAVFMPFTFGQVNPVTFSQSGELERMIQMGTGSMDSATPVGISPRNSTASGMSMILSGAIKRSKRTLANIERNFIIPLIYKTAWRYIQFDPDRYPPRDVKFIVTSTLGIMARELEQQNLANLLKTVPAESPAFWMLIRGIYEMSNITDKEVMLQIIDQMMMKSLNPEPDPVQQQAAQLELQQKAEEIKKIQSETLKNIAQAQDISEGEQPNTEMKDQIDARLKLMLAEIDKQTKLEVAKIDAEAKILQKKMELEAKEEDSEDKPQSNEKETTPSVINVNVDAKQPTSKKIKLNRENGEIVGAVVETEE